MIDAINSYIAGIMSETMFVKNIRSYGSVSGVTIPKKIMNGYDFEDGDLVEIEIRKVE